MAARPEIIEHVEAESNKPDAVGWGMDFDKINKTVHIFNENGTVALIDATPAILAMDRDTFIKRFLHDTIDEVRRQRTDRESGNTMTQPKSIEERLAVIERTP